MRFLTASNFFWTRNTKHVLKSLKLCCSCLSPYICNCYSMFVCFIYCTFYWTIFKSAETQLKSRNRILLSNVFSFLSHFTAEASPGVMKSLPTVSSASLRVDLCLFTSRSCAARCLHMRPLITGCVRIKRVRIWSFVSYVLFLFWSPPRAYTSQTWRGRAVTAHQRGGVYERIVSCFQLPPDKKGRWPFSTSLKGVAILGPGEIPPVPSLR